MATSANQTVLSGHLIEIKIGSTVVGKAQGLDAERSFGTEPIYELGSIMPQEHVHNRYEGSLTLERFFVRTDDLAKAKIAALGNANGEDILSKGVITIVVNDKQKGTALRTYTGCSLVSYRETFRVGAIAGENATFTYLTCT